MLIALGYGFRLAILHYKYAWHLPSKFINMEQVKTSVWLMAHKCKFLSYLHSVYKQLSQCPVKYLSQQHD